MKKQNKSKDLEEQRGWGSAATPTAQEQTAAATEMPLDEEHPIQVVGTSEEMVVFKGKKGELSQGTIRKPKDFLWQELRGITRDSRTLTEKEKTLYLWEEFEPKIEEGAKRAAIGWDFTPGQERAIFTLFEVLKKKSDNNTKLESGDYYMGNAPQLFLDKDLIKVEDAQVQRAPHIKMTEKEWGWHFFGTKTGLTGNDYKTAKGYLRSIARTNYPILVETYSGKKKITYIPLLWLKEESSGNTEPELDAVFNPIFAQGIGDNYFKLPNNLPERIISAYGSKKIPKGAVPLAQYIIRLGYNKKKNYDIALQALCNIVARERMERREKAKAVEMVFQALEVMRKIGLLFSYSPESAEKLPGKGAELKDKVRLTINRSFR